MRTYGRTEPDDRSIIFLQKLVEDGKKQKKKNSGHREDKEDRMGLLHPEHIKVLFYYSHRN